MKMFKNRIISMILAALMILTSVPTAAFAAAEDLPVPVTEGMEADVTETDQEVPEGEVIPEGETSQEEPEKDTEEEAPDVSAADPEIENAGAAAEVTVGAQKAEVQMSMKMGDTFFYLPKTSEISSNLAKSYGFTYGTNVNEGDITPLDVLVQIHIDLYGATKDDIQEYLVVDDSGFIKKMNGVETSSIGFAVNGAAPHDDVETSYGYTGYSANNCKVAAGDDVEFFFYQDESYFLDDYGMFFANGSKITSLEAETGQDISFELKGYNFAYFGNYAQSMIDQQTKAVEDAQLVLVTPDESDANGYLGTGKDIAGAVTDGEGKVTVKFDTAGTYHVSAKCEDEYANPLIAPYLTITVKDAGSSELPELDAEWYDYRNSPYNMAITSAETPVTASETELKWGKKLGEGYSNQAVSSPILVDGYMYCYSGTKLLKIDKETGEVLETGTMAGNSNFSIVPPTYGGGMIFVGLAGGRIQAFNAATLESLWVYRDELGGQPNSSIRYSDGYVYTGFWNSETKDANFVCVKADAAKTETKQAEWTKTIAGGVYWAGAYVTDRYVIVGTDDGEKNYSSNTAFLYSFDKYTGEVISEIGGFAGDIRTDIAYDTVTDRIYFASKGGYLYSAKVSEDGAIDDGSITSFALGGMSTSTPLVYNGRIYIGVSGASNFSPDGHSIKVLQLASDGTATEAYTIPLNAYPQSSALLTTAYESGGYVYAYFTVNSENGEIYVVKDKPGLTEADPGSGVLYTPEDSMKQYCITSAICDRQGTIYYKNDSGYMMALKKSGVLTIETTLEDGMLQRGSRRTFDVIARDREGNKIDATVTFDGQVLKPTWNDSVKASYTLNFSGKEDGEYAVSIEAADADGQTVSRTYTIRYEQAAKGELIGYATMGIEASTINCGYIIEPVKIPVYEGENSAQALGRLIQENGYDYNSTGSLESGFYLSSILGANARRPKTATKDLILDASLNEDLNDLGIDFDAEWGTTGELGEFDYAQGSGWMYCLNNVFPNVGFADSYLSDGDVVRVQFTVAYGSDIGGGFAVGGGGSGKVRANKDDLAAQIAAVNSDQNKEMLLENEAVKEAYDAANAAMLNLPASQTEVDEACETLKNAVAGDVSAAEKVVELIDQIGEVTLDSAEAIDLARTEYEKLSSAQKGRVTNVQKLTDAEKTLYELQEVMRGPVSLSSVKSVNYNTVNVTWKSVKGAEGYRVYRKTAGGSYKGIATVEGQDKTSYRDTGLTTGTSYIYTVRAVYTLGGKSQLGDYVKAGITGKAVPERTVLSKVQSWGYQALKVSWNKVSGASGYRVYYRTSLNGAWKYAAQIANGSTTSYVHNKLTSGKTYYYIVRAYRTVNNTKYFGAYSTGLNGKPVPTQVKNITAKEASATSMKISWSKVNGASGYRIYRIDPKTGKYQYVTQVGKGSTTSYTEKGLKKGTYTYKMRAYRTVNGEKVFGAYSSGIKGTIK